MNEPIPPTGDPVTISAGRIIGHKMDVPFSVEVDAQPLHALVIDAFRGLRVYEFMTIDRPGDIFGYLRIRTVSATDYVTNRMQELKPRWSRAHQGREWGPDWLPMNRFDGLFHWDGDDTTDEAQCWLTFRSNPYWDGVGTELLAWVQDQQAKLRQEADFLTAGEIARIDQRMHRRDYIFGVERRCMEKPMGTGTREVPDSVLHVVSELIKRENVQSVSSPFTGYRFWRMLCEEQIKRSRQTGLPPQEAFTLFGPEGGMWGIPYEDWGADIHSPYEGSCLADLWIMPGFRNAWPERDSDEASLTDIVAYTGRDPGCWDVCYYILTTNDWGELKCATRTEVGDGWRLYQCKRPYEPNPHRKPNLQSKYDGT